MPSNSQLVGTQSGQFGQDQSSTVNNPTLQSLLTSLTQQQQVQQPTQTTSQPLDSLTKKQGGSGIMGLIDMFL